MLCCDGRVLVNLDGFQFRRLKNFFLLLMRFATDYFLVEINGICMLLILL